MDHKTASLAAARSRRMIAAWRRHADKLMSVAATEAEYFGPGSEAALIAAFDACEDTGGRESAHWFDLAGVVEAMRARLPVIQPAANDN